ncbi:MAG: hypothetical protein ACE5IJ_11505 [Thermoplasmata archaeon]
MAVAYVIEVVSFLLGPPGGAVGRELIEIVIMSMVYLVVISAAAIHLYRTGGAEFWVVALFMVFVLLLASTPFKIVKELLP